MKKVVSKSEQRRLEAQGVKSVFFDKKEETARIPMNNIGIHGDLHNVLAKASAAKSRMIRLVNMVCDQDNTPIEETKATPYSFDAIISDLNRSIDSLNANIETLEMKLYGASISNKQTSN